MEQWPGGGADQSSETDQTTDVWQSRFRFTSDTGTECCLADVIGTELFDKPSDP